MRHWMLTCAILLTQTQPSIGSTIAQERIGNSGRLSNRADLAASQSRLLPARVS